MSQEIQTFRLLQKASTITLVPGRALPACALRPNGVMRGRDEPLINASNDLEAVGCWLRERGSNSERTLGNYWLHAERLLLYAGEIKGKALSDLHLEDYRDYIEWLADPQPHERWVGPKAPRGSKNWRPFQGPLSASSIRMSIRVLSSLLGFLRDADYLRANPLALLKTVGREQRTETVERFLDDQMIRLVIDQIESMPTNTFKERAHYERTRWVLILMLTTGMRREEVVTHRQDMFELRRRGNQEQWWARIMGKGHKLRVIPVPDECMDALRRYRAIHQLSDTSLGKDSFPLVMGLYDRSPASATTVYRMVCKVMQAAAVKIEANEPETAEHLRRASPHWLRHTAITFQGNAGISMRHRSKSAGHGSLETTMRYDHAAADEWYTAMLQLPRLFG